VEIYLTETWRLIVPEPRDGPANMAIDEAILTAIGEREAPPTLRFYTWSSPWLSLGSGELSDDLDRTALAERGWGVLRRPSGGTAVLHQEQLGYAVILPSDHPLWRGDLVESYRRLAAPLAAGFAALGAPVEAAPPGANAAFVQCAPALASRVCFGALGPYELLWRGRKLIGNSQVRRRAASLQHGVIQVSGGQNGLIPLLAGADDDERRRLSDFLATHVGSLEEAAGRSIGADEIAGALAVAFEVALDVRLLPGSLTPSEERLTEEFVETKYADAGWTFRR
jgi:lipoyl(octanoyl) transferase